MPRSLVDIHESIRQRQRGEHCFHKLSGIFTSCQAHVSRSFVARQPEDNYPSDDDRGYRGSSSRRDYDRDRDRDRYSRDRRPEYRDERGDYRDR